MIVSSLDKKEIMDTDRLARFRKGETPQETPGEIAPVTGKQPYTAFHTSKDNQRFLELRFKFPEPAECHLNAMMSAMEVEWRWGLGITLVYGNNSMVIAIKGKNLQPVIEAIKECKAVWLAEFDAENHLPIEGDNAPFIESIEITTTRPETAPPMNKRH
jgi:hypothetical protein